eukprot:m.268959 g.268959  ORF g.268959 m.268959 type:complete len:2685 (-) comp19297_c0_seq5:68-8122(-)
MATVGTLDESNRNRFKFINFSEQLKRISIQATRRVGQVLDDVPEDGSSFFFQGIERWRELNITAHFQEFVRAVRGKAEDINLLVLHQDEVIGLVLEHLAVPGSLALEPLLDLTAQLARDLRGDFYPHFDSVFEAISRLLSPEDQQHPVKSEVLQNGFTALTYCFKFLRKQLVKNLLTFFRKFLPMLGSEHKVYVREFAAESFSYLLRKVPVEKLEAHLVEMLECVSAAPTQELSTAFGTLLFETVKNVQHQFQARTDQLLPMYLRLLSHSTDQGDEACCYVAVKHAMSCMAEHTERKHGVVLWQGLLAHIKQLFQLLDRKDPQQQTCLCRVIDVMGVLASWRRGDRIPGDAALQTLCSVLQEQLGRRDPSLPEPIVAALLCLLTSLFRVRSRQLLSWNVLENVVAGGLPEGLVLDFVGELGQHSYTVQNAAQPVVAYLTECILKGQQPVEDGSKKQSKLKQQSKRRRSRAAAQPDQVGQGTPLLSATAQHAVVCLCLWTKTQPHLCSGPLKEKLVALVEAGAAAAASAPAPGQALAPASRLGWLAARCLLRAPGLSDTDHDACLSLAKALWHRVDSLTDTHARDVSVLAATDAACTFLATAAPDGIAAQATFFNNLLKAFPTSHSVVTCYERFLQRAGSESRKVEHLKRVWDVLRDNLNSPDGKLRELTLELLCRFDQPSFVYESLKEAPESEHCTLFEACLSVERIPLDLQTYRDKKIALDKLRHSCYVKHLPDFLQDAPFRYLLGVLQEQFQPIWSDTKAVLLKHAEHNAGVFWQVFSPALDANCKRLCEAVAPGYKGQASESDDHVATDNTDPVAVWSSNRWSEQHPEFRQDALKLHTLLVDLLGQVPAVAVKHNRHIVPLFFNLMSDYDRLYEGAAATQNLISQGDVDEDEESSSDKQLPKARLHGHSQHKIVSVRLADFLIFFSRLYNLQALFESPRLRAVFERLLLRADPGVQANALKSLAAYKFKFLNPYVERVLELVESDGNALKEGLLAFSLDPESGVVNADHRAQLLPIVSRILLGRLAQRKHSGGSKTPKSRRSVILRYVISWTTEDLTDFVSLAFSPFPQTFEADAASVDPTQVVPLTRQLGFIHLVGDFVAHLGAFFQSQIGRVVTILLCLIFRAGVLLDAREQLAARHVMLLKDVRRLGVQRLAQLFASYPKANFAPHYPDVYEVVVRPQLASLRDESLERPSSLLKLFGAWSTDDGFCELLRGEQDTILPSIFSLLSHPSVSTAVETYVLQIADRLLPPLAPVDEVAAAAAAASRKRRRRRRRDGGNDDGDDSNDEDAEAEAAEAQAEALRVQAVRNARAKIVQPHVPVLLSHLAQRLLAGAAKAATTTSDEPGTAKSDIASARALSMLKLSVLERVTPFATIPGESQAMVRLLLPYAGKQYKLPDRTRTPILNIVSNLLSRFGGGLGHFDFLSGLLSFVESPRARLAVCNVFQQLGSEDATLASLGPLLTRLNAMETGTVTDEPDYEVRLKAMFEINDTLVDIVPLRHLLPIVHNYVHFLGLDDLSLRSNAATGIGAVLTRITKIEDEEEQESAFKMLVSKVLLPAVKHGLRSRSEVVRTEFLTLLARMTRVFPTHKSFSELACLTSDDDEADCFKNLVHIQRHRRARALHIVATAVTEGKLTQSVLINYILPFSTQFLEDQRSDHNLLHEVVELFGAAGGVLAWSHYASLLTRFLKQVKEKPEQEKTTIRVLVAVLGAFHFKDQGDDSSTEAEILSKGEPTEAQIEKLYGAASRDMLFKFLPRLNGLLTKTEDSTTTLRAPVAYGIVKLLLQFPAQILEYKLPQLVTKMLVPLRDRMQSVRDATRASLIEITKLVGAHYVPFIIKELRAGLRRGYQLHVLGYTVHAVIEALQPTAAVGSLDDCVPDVLAVIIDDIFGVTGEEKEVDAITAKLKEAKRCQSYACLALLIEKVSPEQFESVLEPLKDVMATSDSLKVSRKIQEMFRHVSLGLRNNTDVTSEDLLKLTYTLIKDNLALSSRGKRTSKAAQHEPKSIFILAPGVTREKTPEACFNANAHILVDLALQIVSGLIRNGKIHKSNETQMSMVDSIVPSLSACLQSKYNKILALALRTLALIASTFGQLPALSHLAHKLAMRTFKLLRRSGNASASDELNQACFKFAAILVKEFPQLPLTANQASVLLNLARADIENTHKQSTIFGLVKAIVRRRIVVAEMYDFVDSLSELMVQSHSPNTRDLCRQAFAVFLLEYPLGKKRLDKHVNFLVANLQYEFDSGREGVLSTLHSLVEKFPEETLGEYHELLFLGLVAQLANVVSSSTRTMVAEVLKTLIRRIDSGRQTVLFDVVLSWLQAEDTSPALLRAAAQTCGFFVDVCGKAFGRFEQESVTALVARVSQAEDPGTGYDAVQDGEWDVLYMCLMTLCKIFSALPSCLKQSTDVSHGYCLWLSLETRLAYPHAWVRLVGSRLLGLLFSTADPSSLPTASNAYLAREGVLGRLAFACIEHLKSRNLSKALADQVLKNLVFLGRALHHRGPLADAADGDEKAEDEIADLADLFHQLAYVARREATQAAEETLRRTCVFKWFAAMASRIADPDAMKPYIGSITQALFRTLESTDSGEEIVDLASQVRVHVEGVVGATEFFQSFNEAREEVAKTRQERKRQRVNQAIVDPVQFARRKQARNLKKRDARKRKVQTYKGNAPGKIKRARSEDE